MPACESFQAAMISAAAQGSIFVDRQVTDLTGGARGAPKNLTVNNKAGSNSRADLNKCNIFFLWYDTRSCFIG